MQDKRKFLHIQTTIFSILLDEESSILDFYLNKYVDHTIPITVGDFKPLKDIESNINKLICTCSLNELVQLFNAYDMETKLYIFCMINFLGSYSIKAEKQVEITPYATLYQRILIDAKFLKFHYDKYPEKFEIDSYQSTCMKFFLEQYNENEAIIPTLLEI